MFDVNWIKINEEKTSLSMPAKLTFHLELVIPSQVQIASLSNVNYLIFLDGLHETA